MGKRLKLIFITCTVDAAFFDPVKKGVADAAEMLGVDADFAGPADVDLAAQAGRVREAVEAGYDGIALNIIHATAFDEVIEEAMGRGVPVVAFNVDGTYGAGPHLSAVCQDFYRAGRTVGERAAAHLPEGARVLITVHDEGISALEDRARGIQEAIAEMRRATWEILVTGTDPARAAERIAAKLVADPALAAVLGTGQADTEGAGRALEGLEGRDDCYAAGFDLSPETLRLIRDGVIDFTVDQQPYVQGFYPVVQLTLYCRYGMAPASMDAGVGLITGDNVDEVMELSARKYR